MPIRREAPPPPALAIHNVDSATWILRLFEPRPRGLFEPQVRGLKLPSWATYPQARPVELLALTQ
jgi:hypothetical protein